MDNTEVEKINLDEKIQSYNVSIKLNTGDQLFAQLVEVGEEAVLTYMPFIASVVKMKSGINLLLRQYDVFSDSKHVVLNKSCIVSITPLDKDHQKMLSDVTLTTQFNEIREELKAQIKLGTIIPAKDLDTYLSRILTTYIQVGMAFKRPIPELKAVKNDFYSYVLGLMEDEKGKH